MWPWVSFQFLDAHSCLDDFVVELDDHYRDASSSTFCGCDSSPLHVLVFQTL